MVSANMTIFLFILITDPAASICGSVIDQQEFKIRICLAEETVEALPQVLFHIIDRHNNTDHLKLPLFFSD
jgi:hypothetical protein